ncbi:hypothetical protein KPH14_006953 [Odynerus spinipes]|uniref:Centrosomal protein of 78 kDa n=1 Tax=Odynerus spinipes TaxID=1348599 RepID=A0AAD9RRL4_9HYME|nr:hypothetical protein KPH14_006953 [Odynerus spinipes]
MPRDIQIWDRGEDDTSTFTKIAKTVEKIEENPSPPPAPRRRRKRAEAPAAVIATNNEMAVPTGKDFTACYMELCKKHHLRPLPVICVTLPHSLDFTTDRVKMEDWKPILNSLSLDRSLRSISIRSRYQYRKPSEIGTQNFEEKVRTKGPVALSRCLLEWLSHSIGQCMRNSLSLTHLELEGIPFPPDCLAVLCVGLAGTETLKHLSLQRCYIGDAGCDLVCRAITDVRTIRSLNLSDCDLTSRCGTALAATLSRQKLSLYHDTWKQSLRYREPNIEAMPGLRKLTLSDNPHLGDSVVLELIAAIRDNLWLKAVELRHCGLTDRISDDLLELLEQNTSLTTLDLRQNPNLNENLVQEIQERLEGKDDGECDWSNSPRKDHKLSRTGLKKKTKKSNKENEVEGGDEQNNRRAPSSVSIATKRSKVLVPTSKDSKDDAPTEPAKKPSLHLDLQSRIKPIMEPTSSRDENQPSVRSSSKIDLQSKNEEKKKVVEITKELMHARTNHDRLLEESKRQDMLLAREKARREIAENKLRTLSSDLVDLENVLREKERETDGFLLVSQRSLNDICTSFDRLVELLESLTRNSELGRKSLEDSLAAGMDVKRRVDSIVRKTKSENLGRGYVVDVEDEEQVEIEEEETNVIVESPRFDAKKFVKSEGDVRRKQQAPLSPVRVERNIGDSPDVVGPSWKGLTLGRFDSGDKSNAAERARDIFLRFVSGEVDGNFALV